MPITLPPPSTSLTAGLVDTIRPGSGASIPPGIEAVLEYNNTMMNMRKWQDTYVVTELGGLDDADVRDTRDVNPGSHGETPFASFYGGRTITITGVIRAHTLNMMRDMQQGLRTSFGDLTTEYPLIFRSQKNPLNDVMIYCKKNSAIQIREAQTSWAFQRDFLITLRASNPRFLSVYSNFGQWFGTSTSYRVVNAGNFSAQPQLQITGPVTNPKLTFSAEASNAITGTIEFVSGTTIPAGETWLIDIAKRSIVNNLGVNKFASLSINSGWPELVAGANLIALSGTGTTGATSSIVMWRNTWL